MKFLNLIHPRHWNRKTYLYSGLVLLALNIFGQRGGVHWLVTHQEAERLERRAIELEQEIADMKKEMSDFKSSAVARERAIRAQLGYLKANEGSVEFSSQAPQKDSHL